MRVKKIGKFVKSRKKKFERVYRCAYCGLVIDRDFNASINLANYEFV